MEGIVWMWERVCGVVRTDEAETEQMGGEKGAEEARGALFVERGLRGDFLKPR